MCKEMRECPIYTKGYEYFRYDNITATKQQAWKKRKGKKGTPTIKKRENQTTKQMRSSLNDINGHMHFQGPSTATCKRLTTYHNVPIDFSSKNIKKKNDSGSNLENTKTSFRSHTNCTNMP
jgi:5-methylcytosine-specific restriction endonuclease McrBC GTP-binding regulatory subunit McrB